MTGHNDAAIQHAAWQVGQAALDTDKIGKLVEALAITAAVLLAEKNRTGGEPFKGRWTIPSIQFAGTVEDALDQAAAALAAITGDPQ